MFRTVSLSIIRSLKLYTQQQVYVTQVKPTSCQQAVIITCMTYTYCRADGARLLMMDRETIRNMQSSIPKTKFCKLVRLVGFIIRIYQDARYSECQRMSNIYIYIYIYMGTLKNKLIILHAQHCVPQKPFKKLRLLSYRTFTDQSYQWKRMKFLSLVTNIPSLTF